MNTESVTWLTSANERAHCFYTTNGFLLVLRPVDADYPQERIPAIARPEEAYNYARAATNDEAQRVITALHQLRADRERAKAVA